MDWQGENRLKILEGTKNRATMRHPSRGPANTRDVCPHLGGLAGPPLHSGREDNENFAPRSEIHLDF